MKRNKGAYFATWIHACASSHLCASREEGLQGVQLSSHRPHCKNVHRRPVRCSPQQYLWSPAIQCPCNRSFIMSPELHSNKWSYTHSSPIPARAYIFRVGPFPVQRPHQPKVSQLDGASPHQQILCNKRACSRHIGATVSRLACGQPEIAALVEPWHVRRPRSAEHCAGHSRPALHPTWFDVSVKEASAVQVSQRLQKLPQPRAHGSFRKVAPPVFGNLVQIGALQVPKGC